MAAVSELACRVRRISGDVFFAHAPQTTRTVLRPRYDHLLSNRITDEFLERSAFSPITILTDRRSNKGIAPGCTPDCDRTGSFRRTSRSTSASPCPRTTPTHPV